MMARMQISLQPGSQRRARARAGVLGISLAEYVRRLIGRDLEEPEPNADPSLVFNLGRSGGGSIARDKDNLVGKAVEAEARGRRRTA